MSYFSFLSTPDNLGVTSCTLGEHTTIKTLSPDEVAHFAQALSRCNASMINQQAAKGRIVLIGKTSTLDGYEKEYPVNDDWVFHAQRANQNTWYYLLKPLNIMATYHYKTGMRKIARKHLNNVVDVDLWVRYDRISKLFYLTEFAKIIDDPKLTKAMLKYIELFDASDYEQWVEHHGWIYPEMSYIHRLYLKKHVSQYCRQIKRYQK